MQGPRQRLNDVGIETAADVLDKAWRYAQGWPADYKGWRELDPIGKSEFLGIVEQIVYAYLDKSN